MIKILFDFILILFFTLKSKEIVIIKRFNDVKGQNNSDFSCVGVKDLFFYFLLFD